MNGTIFGWTPPDDLPLWTLGFIAAMLCFVLAYLYIPDVRDFVRHIGTLLPSFWEDIRQSFR